MTAMQPCVLYLSTAEACSPSTLREPLHGQKSCTALPSNSGFQCMLTCDDGYVFYDQPGQTSINHSCNQGDSWNVEATPACVYASQLFSLFAISVLMINMALIEP